MHLAEKQLVSRPVAIRRMLKPLRGSTEVACDFARTPGVGTRVIAAHDGGVLANAHYRDWRFRTRCGLIHAQYHEVWRDRGSGLEFSWERGYLHLYRRESPAELKPIVALHCDPLDESGYKRGPHVHVIASEQPLPHCHFALNLGELEEVLASAPSLTAALGRAVRLLNDEVVEAHVTMHA